MVHPITILRGFHIGILDLLHPSPRPRGISDSLFGTFLTSHRLNITDDQGKDQRDLQFWPKEIQGSCGGESDIRQQRQADMGLNAIFIMMPGRRSRGPHTTQLTQA